MSATDKGTLVHYILEIIDLERLKKAEDLDDEIDRQIAEFISGGRISQTDAEQVDLRVIHDFYRSETGHNILSSKRVFREKPFILEMDAGKLKDDWKGSRETVLVKGIIDLMYEDEKGDMVIVDYKTSRYTNMKEKQELMKEYSQQLGYYRKAVETLLEKKVSHSFIYFLLYNELTEV